MEIIELITYKRARKCIKCRKSYKEFYIHKEKVICKECLEDYLNLNITCSVCSNKIKRRYEYIPEDKKYFKKTYCNENCFNTYIADLKDLEELDMWLKNYHNVDSLNPRIYVQVNEFKKKYNFTTKGIILTLIYITEVLRKEIQIDNISIIQYYYSNAKQNYVNKMERQKKAEALEKEGYNTYTNIKKVKVNYSNKNTKRILITDLDLDILEG